MTTQTKTPDFVITRVFDGSPELLWKCFTEPERMKEWFGPKGSVVVAAKMDMRVGGKYRWRWRSEEGGQEFGFSGEMLEVVPHSRIVHTQIYDAGDLGVSMGKEATVVTVTFDETRGITSVTTTIRYASKEDRDAAFSTGMTDGMEMNYKLLDEVLRSI